jgi:nucleotide-binding universal stress UspA family protein
MSNVCAVPGVNEPHQIGERPRFTGNRENPTRRGPVLLALHGSETTSAPTAIARRLAERLNVRLEVVTVAEPVRSYGTEFGLGISPLPMEFDFAHTQEELVRRNVREVCGDANWTLSTRYGYPAREISRRAAELDASVVVVAASRHRGLREEVSGVRALQVLRHATCPVLSVSPDCSMLPMTVVAAIDFSPASVRAAEAALLAIDDGGVLILAHAPLPVPVGRTVQDDVGALFTHDVAGAFERLRGELRELLPPNVTLETRQLEGQVAPALLDLATSANAGLITLGAHDRGVIERFFIGSVATKILHAAHCNVLASPDPSASETARLRMKMSDTVALERSEWAGVLEATSRRNVGRHVTLEEDDRSIGVKVQAAGFTLSGIVFDPMRQHVEVMLRGDDATSDHLTRTIGNADAIAINSSPAGVDRAIEIGHGRCRTLLLFDL